MTSKKLNPAPRGAATGLDVVCFPARDNSRESTLPNVEVQARHAVDELIANGAVITYRPAAGPFPPSILYELRRGGDRQTCRRIIADANAEPIIWTALLRIVASLAEVPL